jgi:hypothetical protein
VTREGRRPAAKFVSNHIAGERSSGYHFYVLTTGDDAASAPDVVGEYGFSVGSCKPVETFAGPHHPVTTRFATSPKSHK